MTHAPAKLLPGILNVPILGLIMPRMATALKTRED